MNLVDADNKNAPTVYTEIKGWCWSCRRLIKLKIVDISIRKSLRRGILACLGLQMSQPRLSSFIAVTIPQMTYAINLSTFYSTRPTATTASSGVIYLTDVVLFVRSVLCSPEGQYPDDWIFINVCLVPGIPPERTVPTGGRTIHEMRETKSTGQSA